MTDQQSNTGESGDDLSVAIGRVGSLLCRLGLHRWSDNRGGIKVCTRDGCRSAKPFGLTGTMRRMQWEEELYEDYQRYTEVDDAE